MKFKFENTNWADAFIVFFRLDNFYTRYRNLQKIMTKLEHGVS
jgi:hypothetical protein